MSNIFTDLLSLERTRCQVKEDNQKRVLQLASQLLAEDLADVTSQQIVEYLTQRERLGSTSIGSGIALPHARIPNLSSPELTLITLKQAISFDSIDQQDVDIFCVLLVTEDAADEQLEILAKLANLFRNETFIKQLRSADSTEALFEVATKG
jgi:PTS system nitrogen regulatory IIA component